MALGTDHQHYSDFLSILRRSTELLNQDPIREEIFSVERLEQYAIYLAGQLSVTEKKIKGRSLLPELRDCRKKLLDSYLLIVDAIRDKQAVSPAAEWFVDNFHIIEDQLRKIKFDLPENYYSELPKLSHGELKGYPRVYAIALAIIAHTDCRLDAETLRRFIHAFQRESALQIGELWAVAITLRIALIEQLKPLATRVVSARENREQADHLADQLLELAAKPETEPSDLVKMLVRELGPPEEFDRAFIVQLTQRLRDQDPDVWPAFDWLEKQLNTMGTNTVQVVQLEHRMQAASQVTVGNIVSSMRLLSTLDWRDFFESVSVVDPILAADPIGTYRTMDFQTRDSYRHAVERIAKRSSEPNALTTEVKVARRAVEWAQTARLKNPSDLKKSHVGFYLVGDGLHEFENSFEYRPRWREKVLRFILASPTTVYLSSLAAMTLLILAWVVHYFGEANDGITWVTWLFCVVAGLPATDLALNILNHYITYFITPKPLPKLDLDKGVPEDSAGMVVVPTLFTNESVVNELIENLEVHYLGNQDPHVSFALLGDFADANSEHTDQDEHLLRVAGRGIDELNARYGFEGGPNPEKQKRFYLFHRRRQWNEAEGKWIGWERKRGKLLEFNRLLRGGTNTSYFIHDADPEFLKKVKYVITLDSDTQLPRNCAHRLIGTIAHPLNQPEYSQDLKRVVKGYGILQPRISVSLTSAASSRFAKIFSGNTGLDPYTTAVSDVYQDLFAEGSFTGKGLYVVDAFETALENRVPENAVLSHDLFEGSYARSALVTDIELFDDYPTTYRAFSKRGHRWTRGDWQIMQWLFPKVPDSHGDSTPNNLPLISRWKIYDNLRRSLVAPATLTWLVLAWTFLPGSSGVWEFAVLVMLGFSIYSPFLTGSFIDRRGLSWPQHVRSGWTDFLSKVEQIVLMVAFLPSQAYTNIDAILRTWYRLFISRKKLLEWMTFAQVERERKNKSMAREFFSPEPIFSVLLGILIYQVKPDSLVIAAPFLALWFVNPITERWLRGRTRARVKPLGNSEQRTLRYYARMTWHFFETFVTEKDHWLAPDNFQMDPKPVVAHRTSPTNIGLQLVSTSSAYDFGYLGILEIIERFENVFTTLGKLGQMHGHFFNWYDTLTLEALKPQYISTVDSGNLAGHLICVKQACLELAEFLSEESGAPSFENPKARRGLRDTLRVLLVQLKGVDQPNVEVGGASFRQLQTHLEELLAQLKDRSWDEISARLVEFADMLDALAGESRSAAMTDVQTWMQSAVHQAQEVVRDRSKIIVANEVARLHALANRCDEIVGAMDFSFLFDEQRKIFVIGYNVSDGRKDNSYYDLLASESRLASFMAIAKGDVPEEHWFRLGRQVTSIRGRRSLISWTATMFEYLMPLLVMKRYGETLLDQTYQSVILRQIDYGKQRGAPWGVSEAGYHARDLQLNYQYGPFGVPGLGLKRGLSDDLVISPYSTMLALMVDPWAALENLKKLEKIGAFSKFGFYESIDYTSDRLPEDRRFMIIQSFMAHHQGMSLVSINNLLHQFVMQKRFHADPIVQATQLLLQERIPSRVAISKPRSEELHASSAQHFANHPKPRVYTDVNRLMPRTQILSNGNYSIMVTSAGSGFSRCGPLSISRWREDSTRDHWGQFFYIRNRKTGKYWSATSQPTGATPKSYEASFAEDKIEVRRLDGEIKTHTEIIVSPEDNVELRRVSLTNNSDEVFEGDVTSFMEATLAKAQDDNAHPAFSNLFVQTEFAQNENALLATRRRRSNTEAQVWGFHVAVVEGEVIAPVQYETNRSLFLGRNRSPIDPQVITEGRALTNSVGSVLDPIFSLRQSVRVKPGETVRVCFATGITDSRDDALRKADKYHDQYIFNREAEIAWTQSQVQLRHLNVTVEMAHTFQRLAGRVLYSDPTLRPRSHVLSQNTKPQSALWAYGISGDLPIILTRISDEKDMAMVRELLHAHEYLRLKGLTIDLVILNERAPSYLQTLQDELQRQIRMSGSQALLDKPGGVFIRRTDLMPEADVILLKSVARVSLSAEKGTLEEQLKRRLSDTELTPRFVPESPKRNYPKAPFDAPHLEFFNGLGGFANGGRQYQIILREGQTTPAPWINVVANAHDFGFVVSEAGSGYTWSVNSRENRLTSWSNDAVSDPVSEALYIRDEETGAFWSPTPLPIREAEPYLIRHAQGYTQFEHTSHGIAQDLKLFVPLDANVKISRLTLKNLGTETRKLSVTSFTEWVLGFQRAPSAPFVITELDSATGAIFARNPYNNEFSERVAFADMGELSRSFTADRKEFIGRNGSFARPAAMTRAGLSNRSGAGLDPCASFQRTITLAPGEEKEITVLLGQSENAEAARLLVAKYRSEERIQDAFDKVICYWDETLNAIEIKTPDLAMNSLFNGWLLYQTLACRIWARSAFYQSGGAFGFRDQLQDTMALAYSKPEITREQILRAAQRQFPEGDVQHWWHPPTGRGVRTRFSDDLLWLPFVVSFYIKVTGDRSILDEVVPFIDGPLLTEGVDDSYTHPAISAQNATIYEHCARTIDRSLKVGAHGLPLMGSGDWNDGMSRVGHHGKGESVWVAWFLYSTLRQFLPFCKHEEARTIAYSEHIVELKKAVEENAWDGDWYLRAYFDDGTPMGSAKNQECRIDSIAQSWAVLSGGGNSERTRRAMAAVDEHLISQGDGLIKLFSPPFDHSPVDPGYIKGYVPGVRENGGQYTHAAIWTMMAYATMGDGDRAGELYALLNPINHSSTRAGLHKYKVEPYVVAADVYGLWPHIGRGGWTWYTGSSSWMYRAALESILGFDLRGDTLRMKPSIPRDWREFKMTYRRPLKHAVTTDASATVYEIQVTNSGERAPENTVSIKLDGVVLSSLDIPLVDDGKTHTIHVHI